MKPFSFFKISAGVLALAAMVVTSTVQAATPGNGFDTADIKIVEVKGTATANGKQLQVGDTLKEGVQVNTVGADSSVKATFAESELNLLGDTTVIFEKTKFKRVEGQNVHETVLDLKKGGLIGDVKKLSKASNYNVKHAQGVAGIRGTKWAVLPNQGVVCSEGTVTVNFVVNGVSLPPITLQPGQMVLPPSGPNQTPRVVNIPPEIAELLVNVFRRRDPTGPPPPVRPGERPPSAFTGLGGDVRVEVIVHPNLD